MPQPQKCCLEVQDPLVASFGLLVFLHAVMGQREMEVDGTDVVGRSFGNFEEERVFGERQRCCVLAPLQEGGNDFVSFGGAGHLFLTY